MQPKLSVNSNDAAIEAAETGFGITRLLSYQIAPRLAAGLLVRNFQGDPSGNGYSPILEAVPKLYSSHARVILPYVEDAIAKASK